MLEKNSIVQFARSLGFNEIKFAKAKDLKEETQNLEKWIENGFHADMNWIKDHVELRSNPAKLVESAKTVIVLAHSYNKAYDNLESKGYGKIARYALGRDYHKVIKKKLTKLDKFISQNIDDYRSRFFVDSGPVAERDWAVISGLGARGKNSLILNKQLGSYFFISTIITNQSFQEDEPIRDMCGKCTKCIKACPTGAIEKPYIVNSNKCISYWTIESRADIIPEKIEANMNSWIFGCDICQEVCPWNSHKIQITQELDFFPKKFEPQLDLKKIVDMNENEFIETFSGSPVMRTKLKGLKRNAHSVLKSTTLTDTDKSE